MNTPQPANHMYQGKMQTSIRSRFRKRLKGFLEDTLDIKIYRNHPFGTDPYPAVRELRTWAPHDVVFDVGANDGRSVFRLLQYLPGSSIYAFEPVSSTFQKLEQRTDHLEHVHCFQFALGAQRDREKIYLHDQPSMNSFSREWSEPIGTETVQITPLDDVITQERLDFIHFLKIDTEGHEMAVLEGARNALAASRIAIIQVEVGMDSAVSPHTPFEQVRSYLAPLGYVPHGIFNQHRRGVNPPKEWSTEEKAKYHPSAMKYFDALFVAANLDGVNTGA